MYEWQRWSVQHPVLFWLALVVVVTVMGLGLSLDPLFFVAAFVSGTVWHISAHHVVAEGGFGRGRPRIARAGRGRVISGPTSPSLLSVQTGPYVLLPKGQKIQVTNEENHLAGMDDLLAREEGRPVAATLHRLPPASVRATKERVRVCIDDVPVGDLTTYMAAHFLPLIQLCEEQGLTVACHAVVMGNQLKADVVLDTMKAMDLTDKWIEKHIPGVGQSATDH